jgi:hypothetical protein
MTPDNQLDAVIAAMTKFASNTKNDRLSVEVARVASRVQHIGQPFEPPLTRREMSVVRPFVEQVARAA